MNDAATHGLNGATVAAWLSAAETTLAEQADYLTQLDAAIGDGDHGTNISRGFRAVGDAVRGQAEPAGPGETLALAGRTLLSTVGGASGALWGSALRRAGKSVGDADTIDLERLAAAVDAMVEAVTDLGAAAPGDKTMLDALVPAHEALRAAVGAQGPLADAVAAAATAAESGAQDSAALQARKGRASYLGPRSVGHQDPGATSTSMIFRALARTLAPAS